MFNRDRWKEILEVLTSNVWRTLLTAFGVCWGIYILIILLAAGKGLENGIKKDFGDIATNTMFMWTRSTTKAHMGLPKGRSFEFKLEDVQTIRDNVPNLRFVSPRNRLGGFRNSSNVVRGIKTGAYNVYGDYPEIINQDPMTQNFVVTQYHRFSTILMCLI
ncbi:MAG: ABC transporter permease, partial [Bacteroidota bacterium]